MRPVCLSHEALEITINIGCISQIAGPGDQLMWLVNISAFVCLYINTLFSWTYVTNQRLIPLCMYTCFVQTFCLVYPVLKPKPSFLLAHAMYD